MNFPAKLNPLRGTQMAWLFPFTWALLKCAAVTAPVTLEVFLHHHFGARTGKSLLKGFLLLLVIAPLFQQAFPPAPVPLFGSFIFAYAVASLCQWIRGRFGQHTEHMHSYQTGEPWPIWSQSPFTTTTVQKYIEPGLCLFAAWIVVLFDPPLAHWLCIASGALFIKVQIRYAQLHRHHLDALDGRAETIERAPRARTDNDTFVEARPAPPRRIS